MMGFKYVLHIAAVGGLICIAGCAGRAAPYRKPPPDFDTDRDHRNRNYQREYSQRYQTP
jgi:hypothetical protein